MHVAVITPPEPILTWDELKAALRLDTDEEQDYVEALAAAALSWVGGPDGWLERSVGEQKLELRIACFPPDWIRLPYGPVQADQPVDVSYLDGNRQLQALDAGAYSVTADGRVVVQTRPVTAVDPEAIRVMYLAGEEEVPAALKQAMLLIVGHWYLNREAVTVGNIASTMPFAAEALLSTFRRWP